MRHGAAIAKRDIVFAEEEFIYALGIGIGQWNHI